MNSHDLVFVTQGLFLAYLALRVLLRRTRFYGLHLFAGVCLLYGLVLAVFDLARIGP